MTSLLAPLPRAATEKDFARLLVQLAVDHLRSQPRQCAVVGAAMLASPLTHDSTTARLSTDTGLSVSAVGSPLSSSGQAAPNPARRGRRRAGAPNAVGAGRAKLALPAPARVVGNENVVTLPTTVRPIASDGAPSNHRPGRYEA